MTPELAWMGSDFLDCPGMGAASAGLTTFAPILISFSFKLVSGPVLDRLQRRQPCRKFAEGCSRVREAGAARRWQRTWLHVSRVHLIGHLPTSPVVAFDRPCRWKGVIVAAFA